MRMVSETCVALVEKSQVAKFIADRLKDGWQVQSTQEGPIPEQGSTSDKPREAELEVRLFKQYDINAGTVSR
jgi:hypothetical protein